MTDGGQMVLLLIEMLAAAIFLIISLIVTLKVAEDDRMWIFILLGITVTCFILTFFFDFNASVRWFTIFAIVAVLMIGWLIYLYELSILVMEWVIDYWRTILICFSVLVSTTLSLYVIVQYDLYNEFFWLLLGVTLLSAIIGKPAAVRSTLLVLTKLSIRIIVVCLGVYGIGAVIHMSYNYGFGVFLEFGSDQFKLAWLNYVIFTQFVFGFIVVNGLILMFIPGLNLTGLAFGRLILGGVRTQQDDDDFYKEAKIRKETGFW